MEKTRSTSACTQLTRSLSVQGSGPGTLRLRRTTVCSPFPRQAHLHPLFLGKMNKSPTDMPEHFAHQNSAVRLSAFWVRDTPELRGLLRGMGVPLTLTGGGGMIGITQATRATQPEGSLYRMPSDTTNVVAAGVEVRRLSDVETVPRTNGVPIKKDTDCDEDALGISPSRAHGIWIEFARPAPGRSGWYTFSMNGCDRRGGGVFVMV